jgi:hypothetical protein
MNARAFLWIEYAETKDDEFDGSPVLPGFTDDGIFWACVTSLPAAKRASGEFASSSSNPA